MYVGSQSLENSPRISWRISAYQTRVFYGKHGKLYVYSHPFRPTFGAQNCSNLWLHPKNNHTKVRDYILRNIGLMKTGSGYCLFFYTKQLQNAWETSLFQRLFHGSRGQNTVIIIENVTALNLPKNSNKTYGKLRYFCVFFTNLGPEYCDYHGKSFC